MIKIKERNLQVLSFIEKNKIPLLEHNIITKNVHSTHKMASVLMNGECVMLGNYDDFYPGCHGFDLPDYSRPDGLINLLEMAVKSTQKTCEIVVNRNWSYEA